MLICNNIITMYFRKTSNIWYLLLLLLLLLIIIIINIAFQIPNKWWRWNLKRTRKITETYDYQTPSSTDDDDDDDDNDMRFSFVSPGIGVEGKK